MTEARFFKVTELLTEGNYGTWASDMEDVLTINGLSDALTWDAVPSGKEVVDKKAMAIIRQNVEPHIRSFLRDYKTSKLMWDGLKEMFESNVCVLDAVNGGAHHHVNSIRDGPSLKVSEGTSHVLCRMSRLALQHLCALLP